MENVKKLNLDGFLSMLRGHVLDFIDEHRQVDADHGMWDRRVLILHFCGPPCRVRQQEDCCVSWQLWCAHQPKALGLLTKIAIGGDKTQFVMQQTLEGITQDFCVRADCECSPSVPFSCHSTPRCV